jgi:hypothetical protein
MTTLGKTVFLILSLAALFAVTLAYRSESAGTPTTQLTAGQLAEMQPAPAPAAPAKATHPVPADDGEAGEPPDPEFEDGNGS